MRKTHIHIRWRHIARHLALGAFCVAGAFTLGMESAGDIDTFDTTEAQSVSMEPNDDRVPLRGDIDNDGSLTPDDAVILVHFSEGLETPTPREVRAGDLDGDYQITYRDVLRLLHMLPR